MVGGRPIAPTAPGQRHPLTQPVMRREHAVVAREIDPWGSCDSLDTPAWVFHEDRYLPYFWYPATSSPTLRVEAVVHSPAAFEAHGVLLADRELLVV